MINKRKFYREDNNSWELFEFDFSDYIIPYKVLASCHFKSGDDMKLAREVFKASGQHVSYIYKYALLENIKTGCYFVAVDVSEHRYDGDKCFFTNYENAKEYFVEKVHEYCKG